MTLRALLFGLACGSIACGDAPREASKSQPTAPQVTKKDPQPERCRLSIWGSGPVRERPNASAEVLVKLPEMQFTIVDIQDGYFLYTSTEPVLEDILTAEERDQITKAPSRGWVQTVGLGTRASSNQFRLYEQPDISAPRLIDVKDAGVMPFADGGSISKILDCRGNWAKVTMDNGQESGKEVTGWLSGDHQCDNPLTSCP